MGAFDDLDEAVEDQDRDDGEQRTRDLDVEAIDESATVTDSPDVEDDEDLSRPAFEFSATKQDALYAREEAWNEFEDMLDLDLESELRKRGLRDVPKREKHEAALRVVAEHPEKVADAIEEERTDG